MLTKLEQLVCSVKEESGSTLVEFAVTFPLLVLLALGLVQLGLIFSQYPWFQRSVYEASLFGGETTAQFAPALMHGKFMDLVSIRRSQRVSEPDIQGTYVDSSRTFTLAASGEVNRISGFLGNNFSLHYNSPSLVRDASLVLTDTSIFAQERDGFYYDCDFVLQPTPNNQPCN